MAAATYIPAKLVKSQIDGTKVLDFDTDTYKAMIVVAGAAKPDTSKTGVQFVSDVTGTNAEVTGTGYARQTLTSLTAAFGSGDDVDWSFGNITFAQNASGFTANASAGRGPYLVIFKDTGGADSTNPVAAIFDCAQNISSVSGDVVFSAPSGGLIQWTRSP